MCLEKPDRTVNEVQGGFDEDHRGHVVLLTRLNGSGGMELGGVSMRLKEMEVE